MKSIGKEYIFEDIENSLIQVRKKVVIKNKNLLSFIPILDNQKITINKYNKRKMELTLPPNWSAIYNRRGKVYNLVDNKSRLRISIQNDNIYVYVRYTYKLEPTVVNGKLQVKGIVLDYFKPIHEIPINQDVVNNIIIDTRGNEEEIKSRVDLMCENFMNREYPEWKKPWSYWD